MEILTTVTLYEGMDKVTGEIRYYTIDERSGKIQYYEKAQDYVVVPVCENCALMCCEKCDIFCDYWPVGCEPVRIARVDSRIITKEDNA
jgi:hypothetical protein